MRRYFTIIRPLEVDVSLVSGNTRPLLSQPEPHRVRQLLMGQSLQELVDATGPVSADRSS